MPTDVTTVSEVAVAVEALPAGSMLALRFHAAWCPRCPNVGRLCAALETGFLIENASANVPDAQDLVDEYEIKKLPAVLLIDGSGVRIKLEPATEEEVREAVRQKCGRRTLFELTDEDF